MGSWASGNYRRERRQTTDEMSRIDIGDIAYVPLLPQIWISPPTPELRNLRMRGTDRAVIFGLSAANEIIEIGAANLAYSTRNFGGQQAYFQCQCDKRTTSLYFDGKRIACRQCHGLLYESQFSSKHEQPAAKAAKLRAKLGGGPALLQPIPVKPKGMHAETYERVTYQILAYELAAAKELKRYRDEKWLPVLLKLDELAAEL